MSPSSSLASMSLESPIPSHTHSLYESSLSPTPPSSSPPPPPPSPPPSQALPLARKSRNKPVQMSIYTQVKPSSNMRLQLVQNSSSTSSLSSGRLIDRERPKSRRKKNRQQYSPCQHRNGHNDTQPNPSLHGSGPVNISQTHKHRKQYSSRIPLPQRTFHAKVKSTEVAELQNHDATSLWEDTAVVDSGFGGSPDPHLRHLHGMCLHEMSTPGSSTSTSYLKKKERKRSLSSHSSQSNRSNTSVIL